MDLDEFGLLSILFILPYAVALQILLITFVAKYVAARKEILRMKQDAHNQQAVAAGRVYHYEPQVPVVQNSPAAVPVQAYQQASIPAPVVQTMPLSQPALKKRSRISSTSITFGVGVLLLTIVGAAFLSVSWSFMGNAARAITLIAAVAVVYFLSFLSGKVLKLKQTGFAFYTLGSFLGPIVVVGVGMFRLLGKWFSFYNGNGWIVAAVASFLMALSALIGKYIYKSKFYTGITYLSFTWLVVFIAGQIGDESHYVYPYECIFVSLAVITLILRVIMIFKADSVKKDFRIYSEIMTFASVLMMVISVPVALADNSTKTMVLIGSVLANAALILHAKFTPKREWINKMLPFTALNLFLCLVCFDYKYPRSVWTVLVLFAVLYAVFFLTKVRTLISDILFPAILVFFMMASDDNWQSVYVPVIIAACLGTIMSVLSAVFSKTKISSGINAGLAAFWYYIMSVELMIFLIGDKDQTIYFVLVMPIALVTALVLTLIRRFVKDDHRIRIAAEVLIWASVLFGTIGLAGMPYYDKYRSFKGLVSRDVIYKAFANGILLFFDSVLLWYNYCLNAKKKGKFSISALIITALVLNAPAFVAFVPGMFLGRYKFGIFWNEIAYCIMYAVMAVVLVLLRFAPVFRKEKFLPYVKPMKHIVSAMLCVWTIIGLSSWEPVWSMIAMPVVMFALYFCGNEFFAFIPLIFFECSICEFLSDTIRQGRDINNVVHLILILALFALGRIFYRKRVFSREGIDYLAFVPIFMLFGLRNAPYNGMLIFMTIALMIFNFMGRTRIKAKTVATIALIPVAAALIAQPFINLDEVYMTELTMAIILADAAVIRFLIKPADEKVMKYSWFAIVASCLTVEGISAAISGETFDLIVTGVAAGGIFLFSFIQKSRLWFILGVVSIIGIAVYLSATFWSSMAWLLYLLIAGVIMIGIAAGNEWRKRHSSEGKKLFKEWKW